MPASEPRIAASSSTPRMLCMLNGRRLEHYRKFNDETCAYGTILLYPDGAMMIFHDTAHNGQAQAGTALLGREIGQEEFFFEFAGHTVTRVGDHNFYRVAARHQGSRNLNLTYYGILRRPGSIVHEVGPGALDRLAVSHHLRQIGGPGRVG